MLRNFKKYMITGLITVIPIAVIIYIIWWAFSFLNNSLGSFIYQITGIRIPGISVIISLAIVLFAGIFASFTLGKQLISLIEEQIKKVPLVSDMYVALKQASETFLIQREEFETVVLIEYPREGIYTLGFVTGNSMPVIKEKTDQDLLSVFIPTSPNPTSGYLTFIPKDDTKELNISIQKGLKIIFSGGFLTESGLEEMDLDEKFEDEN